MGQEGSGARAWLLGASLDPVPALFWDEGIGFKVLANPGSSLHRSPTWGWSQKCGLPLSFPELSMCQGQMTDSQPAQSSRGMKQKSPAPWVRGTATLTTS